jgi:hypothetical protein
MTVKFDESGEAYIDVELLWNECGDHWIRYPNGDTIPVILEAYTPKEGQQ